MRKIDVVYICRFESRPEKVEQKVQVQKRRASENGKKN
jgi:hypothetical protein